MKIVSSGRSLYSSEFYKKKKRRKRIWLIIIFVGILLFLYSLIYVSRDARLLIVEVMVREENTIDKEEIEQAVRDMLAGHYIWVIPKTNALIYPRWSIKQSLLEEFPRLKSVNLDLSGFQTLIISVEERAPFALYCARVFNLTEDSDCYFIDKDGFIFAQAPSFSGVAYFVYAVQNPIEEPLGKKFITNEELKQLTGFVENLSALNIYPSALEFRADEYSLYLPSGGQIMWRKNNDLTLIHSNLEAFLSDDSIRAQSNFLDKILYLDLRTENKVFYKFR